MQETVRISLRVLGPFSVVLEGEGRRELRITSRKGCALLAYLAMHPEQCLSREHLADVLWGDHAEVNARQCLRQCILSLRHDLGAATTDILLIDAERIGLNTRHLAVDVVEFRALAQSSVDSDLLRAAELYRGEFVSDLMLDDPFDAWVRKARSDLDSLAAEVFQSCAQRADARQDPKHALLAVERLIALDELREDWQRLALRIYARYRGRGFAMKYAGSVAARLKAELGVDPEPTTTALVASIARGEIVAVSSISSPPDVAAATTAGTDLSHSIASSPERITEHADDSDRSSMYRLAADWVHEKVTRSPRSAVWCVAVASLVGLSALALLRVDQQTGSSGGHAAASVADGLLSSSSLSRRNINDRPLAANGAVSIVVLPFTIVDDATGANQKIADGITDDLINVLSRSQMLRVISRQTAFSYQGHAVDTGALGAKLGVRYVVEGSIRHAGSKFAINVDLVDTADRLQVWADRIEWDTSDQISAQDQLAARIGNELRIEATVAEGMRTAQDHEAQPDVDALLAQGLAAHYRGFSRESLTEELGLFENALRRDPELQPAMIGVAMSLTSAVLNSLSDNPEADLDRADDLLNRTMQMDPRSYRVYFWKGLVFTARRNYQAAYDMLSKCIEINPSATYAHAHLGNVLVKLGRAQEGLDHIRFAIRLSPKDSFASQFYLSAAQAELELHHDEAAIEWLRSAIASQPHNPSVYKYLAATYALLGNQADAARNWDEFRKLSVASGLGRLVDRVKAVSTSRFPHAPSRLIQGLALVVTS